MAKKNKTVQKWSIPQDDIDDFQRSAKKDVEDFLSKLRDKKEFGELTKAQAQKEIKRLYEKAKTNRDNYKEKLLKNPADVVSRLEWYYWKTNADILSTRVYIKPQKAEKAKSLREHFVNNKEVYEKAKNAIEKTIVGKNGKLSKPKLSNAATVWEFFKFSNLLKKSSEKHPFCHALAKEFNDKISGGGISDKGLYNSSLADKLIEHMK